MNSIQIALLGVVGTLLALQFKSGKSEYGIYVSLAVSLFLFLCMLSRLEIFVQTVKKIADYIKLDAGQMSILLKMAGVTYVAEFGLISHVVTNLLKNAVEAFNDLQSIPTTKPFICLHAYTNEQEAVIIDVSNNAGLIPDDIASHIFIPFFTTKSEGSGIGLSLSHQIMRVSGGSLTLHQDKEQGITTFRIVIP